VIHWIVLPVVFCVVLTGVISAQPDRTAEIEKAKTKFEKDIAKAEETFLANLDKAITKAQTGGNKALTEKLTFEREGLAFADMEVCRVEAVSVQLAAPGTSEMSFIVSQLK
jgi:hypothetical protein